MDQGPQNNWGVHIYGVYLSIDETNPVFDESLPFVIDCETDEHDNFCGIGLTQDGKTVYYYSRLELISRLFEKGIGVIGHNLKADAKWLTKWGCPLKSEQLLQDTILMSYVTNTTKESHGLKDLGVELGFKWPSYKEIVGSGRAKKTLDKQPLELVANYCGMDVLVTYHLYNNFNSKMDLNQRRVYSQIEMPLMRILYEMELQGVLIDVNKLRELDKKFNARLETLRSSLRRLAGKEINPNSNKQVGDVLTEMGFCLPKTQKGNLKVDKFVLEQYKDEEFVKTLLEYNKIEKLVSTYTSGLLKRETLPRIYTTYNQIIISQKDERGISTGRLSSSNPNLQQIPARTDEGKEIRELFIPQEQKTLIDIDYSQIEYRLLAHFSKEPVLLEAYRTGKDVHEETGKLLGVDRDLGKTLNFAAVYGSQPKKIAQTAKCSEDEAEVFLKKYWSKLPYVTAWINRVKFEAKQKKGIYTLMKRWIPIPGILSDNKFERFHWERAAVNYLIQGSGAEIMKMAMIELRKQGYLPLLTVHDELLFEDDGLNKEEQESHASVIKHIMESIVKLDVPLIAEVGIGGSWRDAKGD